MCCLGISFDESLLEIWCVESNEFIVSFDGLCCLCLFCNVDGFVDRIVLEMDCVC